MGKQKSILDPLFSNETTPNWFINGIVKGSLKNLSSIGFLPVIGPDRQEYAYVQLHL